MAIGDATDLAARLKRLVPRWFGQDQGPTPVVDGLLQGPAAAFSWVYSLYCFAVTQSRIATVTGPFLDLAAWDFFGRDLPRRPNQSDASFRAAVLALLFQPRATRPSLYATLVAITGNAPRIYEPTRALDCGGYDLAGGYDVAGAWGSFTDFAQVWVDIQRPVPLGIPLVSGYDQSAGGYDTSSPLEWAPEGDNEALLDAEIYRAVDRVRPAGVIVWVRIHDGLETLGYVGGASYYSDGTRYGDAAQHNQPTEPTP